MSEWFSQVALSMASFAACVAALDFFLSDKQKAVLDQFSVLLWYRLANINIWSKIDVYKSDEFHREVFIYGASVVVLLNSTFYSFSLLIGGGTVGAAVIEFGIGLVVALLWWRFYLWLYSVESVRLRSQSIHWWVLRGKSVFHIFVKATSATILLSFLLLLQLAILTAVSAFNPVLGFLFLILTAVAGAPFAVGFGIVDMLFIRIITLATLGIPVAILEFLARRIAEYKKGVVLGVSAFLGSVAVTLSYFF